jgi:hypothetical protein
MENQMLGFHFSSGPKIASGPGIACMAVAALMLSTPASFAASAQAQPHVRATPHVTVYPHARVRYPSTFEDYSDRTNVCIGGYRWMRHYYDANRTAAQDEVPLPCR